MRLITAKIKGLKGIYSKSGVKEIFIDFNKCTSPSNITFIIGKNGSGKSTLLSALQPLPVSPSMFIDGEYGEEELVYENKCVLYRILIQYPVYANGSRGATKAFISKTTADGNIIELNENGTIGSYKAILFSEFCLDPNFISLSHLSVEDRGIVEKTPKDRKKLVSELLESIEVYNDIYKTLVKRSSVFKAMISTLSSKIDSIGDESSLVMTKNANEVRINTLQQNKKSLEDQIAMSRASISVIDPTGEIQENYKKLFESLNVTKDQITMIESSIDKIGMVKSLDEALSLFLDLKNKIAETEGIISSIQNDIQLSLSKRAEDASMITAKSQKLESLTSEYNIRELSTLISNHRKKIFECEEFFKKLDITGKIMTSSEFHTALNVFNQIKNSVMNIRSYANLSNIEAACQEYLLGYEDNSLLSSINKLKQDISDNENKITDLTQSIAVCRSLRDKLSILSQRPTDCTINNCSFIVDALKAQELEPVERESNLEHKRLELQAKLNKQKEELERLENIYKIYMDLDHIYRYIQSNRNIIQKLPIGDSYVDIATFAVKIMSGDTFNDIVELQRHAGKSALFDQYIEAKNVLAKLEGQYNLIKAQESIVDDIQKEIDLLIKKVADIDKYIENRNIEIAQKTQLVEKWGEQSVALDSIISMYRKLDTLYTERSDIESQLKVVSENIEKISKEIKKINSSTSQLASINNEIEPLLQSQSSIDYSLSKLADYKKEYQMYSDKQNTIDLIKKYSSPTKGGIQTVFMQLYMDKTLSLSNEILQLMFDGSLEILPYIINENEFRIPIKNNITNLVVDDISNCSTSEKSMIAMIMSFVLGFHSSREYNIIRLDEIDGGLDQYNRSMFPIILSKIMCILNIEQCFIISHSSEFDLSDMDVINLSPVSNEAIKGNVIFRL